MHQGYENAPYHYTFFISSPFSIRQDFHTQTFNSVLEEWCPLCAP
jgi:hypothetical protein